MKRCRECKKEVSTSAKTCPHCGISNPSGSMSNGLRIFLIVVGIVVGLNLLGRLTGGLKPTSSSDRNSAPAVSAKEIALAGVSFDFVWSRDESGNTMTANFSITNPTEYAVKDIQVTCVHKTASGAEIGRSVRTLYVVVSAKETKRLKDVNMGIIPSEAKTSLCHISDLRMG